MSREIPEVIRAVAGLTATVLDEARNLPRSLFGLPVRLLGMAMQTSLKLQQQYSGLVARGDEVFTGLWGEAEPGLATFDEDLPATPAPRTANRSSAFDRAADDGLGAGVLTEEALTQQERSEEELTEALVEELAGDPADLTVELSDEIADLSEGGELADVAGMTDLVALADGDSDDTSDDAPLADVLAFETMAADGDEITDAQVAGLPADPPADTVTETVDELAADVDAELAAELPESVPDEVADDLAADTVATVADAEVAAEEARNGAGGSPGSVPDEATVRDLGLMGTADATEPDTDIADLSLPEPSADAAPAAEAGGVSGTAAIEGIVADDTAAAETPTIEGVSADDTAASDTATSDTATSDTNPTGTDPDAAAAPEDAVSGEGPAPVEATAAPDETAAPDDPAGGGDLAGSQAAGTAPVEGYDGFSIPSLRGHLRSYPAETVADLLDYERATRARAPYLTLLQNRLEKLDADRA